MSNDAEAIRAAIRKHFADGGEAAFTLEQLLVRFDQFFAESEELVAAVATVRPKRKIFDVALNRVTFLTKVIAANKWPDANCSATLLHNILLTSLYTIDVTAMGR